MTTQTITKLLNKPGPLSKLDQAMIDALSDLVAKGNYYHDACEICGISEKTFYDWVNKALIDETSGLTEAESMYIKFSKSIKRARSLNRADLVSVIKEAAFVKREWLPAITFLERTDPEHWGRKDRTRIDINETKTVTITHVEYTLAGAPPGQVIEGESRELLE